MPRWIRPLILIFPLLATTMLAAEEPDGDALLEQYFRQETAHVREQALGWTDSLESWKQRRPELKRQFASMLGLDPLPERTPLNVQIRGTREDGDVIAERLSYESRPGLYVTATLYHPREQDKPLPGILYVCGHARVEEDGVKYGNKVAYQHHGVWFARNGYVCLTIDTLQLGEIEGLHHGVYPRAKKPSSTPENPVYDTHGWWYTRGYSPAGVETWNGMRGIDYLQSRDEVDPERIGVTGRSGGGAYSWFIAAMDERVKAAVPVAGITDLADHVVNDCIEGHCDCMYYTNLYRWDFPLMAAMIAPRALLLSNTDNDRIFPLHGVVRTRDFTQQVYDFYDAGEKFGIHITEGPHSDTQELRIGAFVWFERFLKDEESVIKDPGDKPFTPEELKVFDSIPEDEKNTSIDETFVAKAETPEVPKSKKTWKSLKGDWIEKLRETTFNGWPETSEMPNPKLVETTEQNKLVIRKYLIKTQTPYRLPIYLVTRKGSDMPSRVTFQPVDESQWSAMAAAIGIAGDQDEKDADNVRHWRERLDSIDGTLAIFAPRGVGPTAWTDDPKQRVHIRRRFMLLGQSQAGMRAWDVRQALKALETIEETGNAPVHLVAEGPRAATWGLAAVWDAPVALKSVRLEGLPASFEEGPELLGITRFLDVPQMAALVADQTKVILTGDNWDWLSSAADNLGWTVRVDESS